MYEEKFPPYLSTLFCQTIPLTVRSYLVHSFVLAPQLALI